MSPKSGTPQPEMATYTCHVCKREWPQQGAALKPGLTEIGNRQLSAHSQDGAAGYWRREILGYAGEPDEHGNLIPTWGEWEFIGPCCEKADSGPDDWGEDDDDEDEWDDWSEDDDADWFDENEWSAEDDEWDDGPKEWEGEEPDGSEDEIPF